MQLLQGNCPRGRRGFRNRSSPSANISQRKQIGEKNTQNNPTRVMATPWLRSQSQHPHLSIQPVSVPCANCRRAPVFPFVSLPCPWNLAGMRRKHPVFTRRSESAFHASGPPEAFPPTSHKQPGSGVASVWCVISGSPNSFHAVFRKHRRAFTLRVSKGVKKKEDNNRTKRYQPLIDLEWCSDRADCNYLSFLTRLTCNWDTSCR